jgi:lipopolysaccharide export system permease protein
VRRLLYRDIVSSVAFVAVAFLSLFYFIDFVDELDGVGSRGRTVLTAAMAAVYELPSHAYELMPIAVLIGTIYSLARMAQGSEFTILRTGGLGPRRALLLLAALGVGFAGLTLFIGDVVAPASERRAVLQKANLAGGMRLAGAGAWLKEKQPGADGEHSISVNVGGLAADGTLEDVRVFDFDATGRLVRRLQAPRGRVGPDGHWSLDDTIELRWPA